MIFLLNIDALEVNAAMNLTDSTYRSCKPCIQIRETSIAGGYSLDGQCGSDHDDLICSPEHANYLYNGTCCSASGWCGDTIFHCGAGCVSGCTDTYSIPASGSVSIDGTCGADNYGMICPKGQCCSQYGYCGVGTDYCGSALSSSSVLSYSASSIVISSKSKDGTSQQVSTTSHSIASSIVSLSTTSTSETVLPSVYSTTIATGDEPVLGKPTSTSLTSTATSTYAVTSDGTCGAANDNMVCGDWIYGNCCSEYGFCGNTSSHCGDGCQSGDCYNDPVEAAPSAIPAPIALGDDAGEFEIIGESGVPAMHGGLLPNGKIFFLDKVEDYTQIVLDTGYYAYSTEYDLSSNSYTGLAYKSNAFCSGGTYLANGDVISVGGNADLSWLDPTVGNGFRGIRYLKRSINDSSLDGTAWSEPGNELDTARWYATAQNLANGEVFVASGSLNGLDPSVAANNNPTYEILDKAGKSYGESIPMDILSHNQPYYMYPFVHLLRDGNIFIFVSRSSEIFNITSNVTVKSLPDLAGDYRTYPNTGGSVLLPLYSSNNYAADIVVCGGGSYQDITSPTDASCGRIQVEDDDPTWELEAMPIGRDMVEGILLPDGKAVWLNGGNIGSQGFNLSRDPVYESLLYDPDKEVGARFTVLANSTIARLYHSIATLTPDGTILIAGSNPVQMPILTPDQYTPYVTEFRVEIFTPPYLMGNNREIRPRNLTLSSTYLQNGDNFTLSYINGTSGTSSVKVVLYHGGFVTHSLHMGHRMIYLDYDSLVSESSEGTMRTLRVKMPAIGYESVTPPGPYMIFVVADGIPSVGEMVMVNADMSF
ncbi:glyoxal oxidase N-terminus-domain-containing protein [Dipodascopsis uninucleata]